MNQRRFTASRLRLRAPARSHAFSLLGALCAVACGNRYEIGDIVAKQAPQPSASSPRSAPATAVSAVPRTIIADAYDVDATAEEPDPTNIDRETIIVPRRRRWRRPR